MRFMLRHFSPSRSIPADSRNYFTKTEVSSSTLKSSCVAIVSNGAMLVATECFFPTDPHVVWIDTPSSWSSFPFVPLRPNPHHLPVLFNSSFFSSSPFLSRFLFPVSPIVHFCGLSCCLFAHCLTFLFAELLVSANTMIFVTRCFPLIGSDSSNELNHWLSISTNSPLINHWLTISTN